MIYIFHLLFNFFLIFCSFTFLFPCDEEQKPYVSCSLHGQLGNQMHQIATTLAFAWDHNMVPLFPELMKKEYNLPMNYQRIFFRLNSSPLPRPILQRFKQWKNFEKIDIPIRPNQVLDGYFQTWEYYHHHRDRLLELFSPAQEELDFIKSKYNKLLSHSCTVGVHVRTFNKQLSNDIPFVGLDYYHRAMALYPPEALFIVFSDRINWCKHYFSKFNRPVVFINSGDHIEDFFLMSQLKHNIIGNSSYSWWAAYLNKNPDKVVVAPSHFVHPSIQKKVNANLPDWITLDIDYDYRQAPYPEDICDYDLFSQSIDTQ